MERIGRIKKLWEIRNKKNNKNIIDLKITIFLKTEIIVKEWKKRAAKFIFDGKTYLEPLIDRINVRSLILLTTELE